MSELYYIEPSEREALTRGEAILVGPEAKHVARVMRKKQGDVLELFDGSGALYRAQITNIERERVVAQVLDTTRENREPALALTVVCALPKGERQKWALEKLAEFGVKRVIPLDAERADVKFDDDVRARLRRQSLEASKQCGRLYITDVTPSIRPSELPALVELLDARRRGALAPQNALTARFADSDLFAEFAPGDDVWRVVAHPRSDGDFGQRSFGRLRDSRAVPRGALVLIGPVGGFTQEEVRAAVDGGWEPLDLGEQVYRVETAAIALAALFLHMD